MLKDEETGDPVFGIVVGEKSKEVTKLRIPVYQGIAGRVSDALVQSRLSSRL